MIRFATKYQLRKLRRQIANDWNVYKRKVWDYAVPISRVITTAKKNVIPYIFFWRELFTLLVRHVRWITNWRIGLLQRIKHFLKKLAESEYYRVRPSPSTKDDERYMYDCCKSREEPSCFHDIISNLHASLLRYYLCRWYGNVFLVWSNYDFKQFFTGGAGIYYNV